MKALMGGIAGFFLRYVGNMRFPQLFLLTAVLFVVDLLIPDVVPLVDEILLGLLTALFAAWRRRGEDEPAEKDSGH